MSFSDKIFSWGEKEGVQKAFGWIVRTVFAVGVGASIGQAAGSVTKEAMEDSNDGFWKNLAEDAIGAGTSIFNNKVNQGANVSIAQSNAQAVAGVVKFVTVIAAIWLAASYLFGGGRKKKWF